MSYASYRYLAVCIQTAGVSTIAESKEQQNTVFHAELIQKVRSFRSS